ncbi:MAG TPA: hypothetical protein VHJ34_02740 [Actinomycetota bacterium]|nr:hypothetical protein [Actinomycetota bacterium]
MGDWVRFEKGGRSGGVAWHAPGWIELDVGDPRERRFLERYLCSEDAFLAGSVAEMELEAERPDSSPAALERALFNLGYRVHYADGSARERVS